MKLNHAAAESWVTSPEGRGRIAALARDPGEGLLYDERAPPHPECALEAHIPTYPRRWGEVDRGCVNTSAISSSSKLDNTIPK